MTPERLAELRAFAETYAPEFRAVFAELDDARRKAGALAAAVTTWMSARHPETTADHERQWAAVGAVAAACKAIPEDWRTP